jgi:tetratricopeptide (TPR) repeat protein
LLGSSEDSAVRRSAAEKAVGLDSTSSDARDQLGLAKFFSWDWKGAEEDFRRAIELNPNDAAAHDTLSHFLYSVRRMDEGWKESQIAEELDPNQDHLSYALYWRREYDQSIELVLKIIEGDRDNGPAYGLLYMNYMAKGLHKDAFRALERFFTLYGFPEAAAHVDHAFSAAGYEGALRQYAKEMEHAQATKQIFVPWNLAGVYAALGDRNRALFWLEQAYRHRDMTSDDPGLTLLDIDPALDPLRSDPRFKNLAHRVGLPP